MWSKTAAGLILGLLLTVSIILNLFFALPLEQDTKLLSGLLLGFVAWGGIMTWCYSFQSTWQSARVLLPALVVSALLNYWLI